MLGWMRRQPVRVKIIMAITAVVVVLAALNMFVEDHNHFFVASEAIHAAGILVLIHKLNTKRNCSGIIPFMLLTLNLIQIRHMHNRQGIIPFDV